MAFTQRTTTVDKTDKQRVQMQYLEQENQNLVLENEDLLTTLRINKQIIKNLLEGDQKYDAQVEYAITQINQENEMWEARVKTLKEQRDSLQAQMLM